MKTIYLFFMLNYNQPEQSKIDLHLPPHSYKKTSFNVRFIMKDNYFFQGDIANWSTMSLNAKFVFPTENMKISVNLRFPNIIDNLDIKL